MLHCLFEEFILIVAIAEMTPETRILIVCKLLEEVEGQLPWLNQNLNNQNYRPISWVRHVFRVQLYTGSLWLSSSF